MTSLTSVGSPLRIAPNIIVFDDPGVIRLVNTPKEPFVRGQWFKAMKFDPRTDNLLSVTDEEQHARMRRNMIPGVGTVSFGNVANHLTVQWF